MAEPGPPAVHILAGRRHSLSVQGSTPLRYLPSSCLVVSPLSSTMWSAQIISTCLSGPLSCFRVLLTFAPT
jgi:hypothetical protein